jgi:hypothetical protein
MTTDQNTRHSHLSADLEVLHDRLKGKSLTIGELKQGLKARGSAMLLVLLAFPFCFIAIPGLSMPFGIAICLIGTCLVIGREPWLPRCIMRRRLSTARLAQLLSEAIKMARQLEKYVEHYELMTGNNGKPIELGRGAMGVTYKAIHVDLHCPVTLKVISERYLGQNRCDFGFYAKPARRRAFVTRMLPRCSTWPKRSH